MPIHDLGYRAWEGRLGSEATRWWVISRTGIRLAWRSRLLRRFVLLAWLPALYMGIAFFMWEQAASHPEMKLAAMQFFRGFGGEQAAEVLSTASITDPASGRHEVWGWLLLVFFRQPQGVLMALVVGMIAPPLISQDIRSRAMLLYFSRPITRWEYVFGKFVVVAFYVLIITTAPALALYTFGVLLSPDLSVLKYTWDFPPRILLCSLVLTIPTTSIALAFSSLTVRSYQAGFAWFATWAVGFITYEFVRGASIEEFSDRWSLVSLHHTLGLVQSWIFNITERSPAAPIALALLGLLSVLSLAIVFQRVTACTRQ
jgi:ABC-type transport system involved in multi-copper enzyme maturation permease subunit